MSNGLIRKVGVKGQDQARQFGKKLAQEPHEFLNAAKAQISKDTPTGQPQAPQGQVGIGSGVSEISPEEKKKIEDAARKRLQEIEQELSNLRLKRRQDYEKWVKEQEAMMGGAQQEKLQEQKPLVEPTTVPKRGMITQVKQKQGTKEIAKQVSG